MENEIEKRNRPKRIKALVGRGPSVVVLGGPGVRVPHLQPISLADRCLQIV